MWDAFEILYQPIQLRHLTDLDGVASTMSMIGLIDLGHQRLIEENDFLLQVIGLESLSNPPLPVCMSQWQNYTPV